MFIYVQYMKLCLTEFSSYLGGPVSLVGPVILGDLIFVGGGPVSSLDAMYYKELDKFIMSHASSESNYTISEALSDTHYLWYNLDNYRHVIRERIRTHTMSTPLAVEPTR